MTIKNSSIGWFFFMSLWCAILGDEEIKANRDTFQIEFIAKRGSIERFQITKTSEKNLRWSYVNRQDAIAGTLSVSLDTQKWLEIERALEAEIQNSSNPSPILYIREQAAETPKTVLCSQARAAGVFLFGKAGILQEIGPELVQLKLSRKSSMIYSLVTADLSGGDLSEDLDKQRRR